MERLSIDKKWLWSSKASERVLVKDSKGRIGSHRKIIFDDFPPLIVINFMRLDWALTPAAEHKNSFASAARGVIASTYIKIWLTLPFVVFDAEREARLDIYTYIARLRCQLSWLTYLKAGGIVPKNWQLSLVPLLTKLQFDQPNFDITKQSLNNNTQWATQLRITIRQTNKQIYKPATIPVLEVQNCEVDHFLSLLSWLAAKTLSICSVSIHPSARNEELYVSEYSYCKSTWLYLQRAHVGEFWLTWLNLVNSNQS